MEQVAYQPRFRNTLSISVPKVLGIENDYHDYFQLLKLNIFKFYEDSDFGHNQQIPNTDIHKYIDKLYTLQIIIKVTYNSKVYQGGIKVTNDIIRNIRNDDERIYFLFDAMLRLIDQVKHSLYVDFPYYKMELDDLYTQQYHMMRTVDGMASGQFDYIRERINHIEEKMNKEFERIIMFIEGGEPVEQSIRDFPIENPLDVIDEEEEFLDVESKLNRSSKTLRLTRLAIKSLPKSISNKFILPLSIEKLEDKEKFDSLIDKPFSFLEYNGAKFSIDLETNDVDGWDNKNDTIMFHTLILNRIHAYEDIVKSLARKNNRRVDRILKLNKVYNKLGNHITYLKGNFSARSEKFGNNKYLKFIGERTITNIKKIRKSQDIAQRKINVLRNKRLDKKPKQFFERMLKLFLGETGNDIIIDLETLNYTSEADAKLGISYLIFLLDIIDSNDEFTSPVLPILDSTFKDGFENIEMLKIIAGHMFIHTITIKKGIKI